MANKEYSHGKLLLRPGPEHMFNGAIQYTSYPTSRGILMLCSNAGLLAPTLFLYTFDRTALTMAAPGLPDADPSEPSDRISEEPDSQSWAPDVVENPTTPTPSSTDLVLNQCMSCGRQSNFFCLRCRREVCGFYPCSWRWCAICFNDRACALCAQACHGSADPRMQWW